MINEAKFKAQLYVDRKQKNLTRPQCWEGTGATVSANVTSPRRHATLLYTLYTCVLVLAYDCCRSEVLRFILIVLMASSIRLGTLIQG